MKFVPKFHLGILLHVKHLLSPVHDIFLGLMSPFFIDEGESLIILVVKLS
jgi:hypothetical protein